MSRILIDATSTATTTGNTGIQRVVRRVAECSRLLETELGVTCIPFRYHRGRFFKADSVAGITSWDERLLKRLNQVSANLVRTIDTHVSALSPTVSRTIKRIATRCRKLLYPRSLVRSVTFSIERMRGREIYPQPDDIILLLDASWTTPPALYEEVRKQGCYMRELVYDLLPITHRQYVLPSFSEQFTNWLECAIEHFDCCWSISRTVRDELYAYYLNCHANQNCDSTDVPEPRLSANRFRDFRLGADLASGDLAGVPRPSMRSISTGIIPSSSRLGR